MRVEQQAQLLVEDEQRGLLAARDRGDDEEDHGNSDLPVPAGPSISVLEPVSMPPPSKLVEFGDAARQTRGETACDARPPPAAETPSRRRS